MAGGRSATDAVLGARLPLMPPMRALRHGSREQRRESSAQLALLLRCDFVQEADPEALEDLLGCRLALRLDGARVELPKVGGGGVLTFRPSAPLPLARCACACCGVMPPI